MNGYCDAVTNRKVSLQWILRDKTEWLGLEAVFWKLRLLFQRNWLTRKMRLMKKRKDIIGWLGIPDSWCPVREKGPCPFSLICPTIPPLPSAGTFVGRNDDGPGSPVVGLHAGSEPDPIYPGSEWLQVQRLPDQALWFQTIWPGWQILQHHNGEARPDFTLQRHQHLYSCQHDRYQGDLWW